MHKPKQVMTTKTTVYNSKNTTQRGRQTSTIMKAQRTKKISLEEQINENQ